MAEQPAGGAPASQQSRRGWGIGPLEREEASAREEAFLARLSSLLRRSRAGPQGVHPEVQLGPLPPPVYGPWAESVVGRVETFCQELAAVNGRPMVIGRLEQLAPTLLAVAKEVGARRVVRSADPRLGAVEGTLREAGLEVVAWDTLPARQEAIAQAAAADLGLAWAPLGIAETGTVVLPSGRAQGRAVTLLPPAIVVVLEASQVVATRREALRQLLQGARPGQRLPSAVNLVTGPSRTSDIENDLTIGVHGSGRVYVVIVGGGV